MFFLLPSLLILAVYVLAAVIPAFLLLRYIYRHDTIEKEPPGLIVTLLLLGVAAALVSIVFERLGRALLDGLLDAGSPVYSIAFAFLVVAVVEEGAKFLFLKWRSWNDPNFNYRFDGIVYAVSVSLGFAAFENIMYVMRYGLSVAVPRALLAIPGHMSFAVFMGVFYGRAKLCEAAGDLSGKRFNLIAGYIVAVALHGFYDACAMVGTVLSMVIFIVFIVAMYIAVHRLVKRESMSDHPI